MTDPQPGDALLPCPFCGGKARYRVRKQSYVCSNIDCEAEGPASEDDGDSAAQRWNRRHKETS